MKKDTFYLANQYMKKPKSFVDIAQKSIESIMQKIKIQQILLTDDNFVVTI